jgi:hypothetical protein
MTDTATPEAEAGASDASRADAVEKLLDRVGETMARQTLAGMGNRAGLQLLERIVARRIAAEMLAAQQPRQAIRERLIGRGLSLRTAYRLLDAAAAMVGLKPSAPAAPAPALHTTVNPEPSPMTEPTTQVEAIKQSILAALAAERGGLRRAMDETLQAHARLEERIVEARQRKAESMRALPSGGGITLENIDPNRVKGPADLHFEACGAVGAAESELRRFETTDAWRGREIAARRLAELDALLTCEERLGAAAAGAAGTARELLLADEKLRACDAAAGKLAGMVADERQADSARMRETAGNLLAAVKAGGDAAFAPVDAGRLAVLEQAKAEADRELEEARTARAAAASRHGAAVALRDGVEATLGKLHALIIERAGADAAAVARGRARSLLAAEVAALMQQQPEAEALA